MLLAEYQRPPTTSFSTCRFAAHLLQALAGIDNHCALVACRARQIDVWTRAKFIALLVRSGSRSPARRRPASTGTSKSSVRSGRRRPAPASITLSRRRNAAATALVGVGGTVKRRTARSYRHPAPDESPWRCVRRAPESAAFRQRYAARGHAAGYRGRVHRAR